MVAIVDALLLFCICQTKCSAAGRLYVFVTGGNFIMTFQERLITLRKQQGLLRSSSDMSSELRPPDRFKMGAWGSLR